MNSQKIEDFNKKLNKHCANHQCVECVFGDTTNLKCYMSCLRQMFANIKEVVDKKKSNC